jgi:DnaJ-class molecular chaperone
MKHRGISTHNQTGHQFIHFHVMVPTSLTDNQKKLIQEFSKEEELPKEQSKGFFDRIREFMNKK